MHVRQPALDAVVPEAVEAGEMQEEVRLSAASVHPISVKEKLDRQTERKAKIINRKTML
jgi:hypothetical protein